jgi:alkylation response protein AidB-like acyl-CoA dehydrogenase
MVNSGEPTKLMEAARALRPRILAERERIEAARRLPEDLTQELAREGFFRIYLPAAYGGLDLTPMAATEVFEELARADASVAWCVWNGNTYWTTLGGQRRLPKQSLLIRIRFSRTVPAPVDGRRSSRMVTG